MHSGRPKETVQQMETFVRKDEINGRMQANEQYVPKFVLCHQINSRHGVCGKQRNCPQRKGSPSTFQKSVWKRF
jgi:hypothetical protein